MAFSLRPPRKCAKLLQIFLRISRRCPAYWIITDPHYVEFGTPRAMSCSTRTESKAVPGRRNEWRDYLLAGQLWQASLWNSQIFFWLEINQKKKKIYISKLRSDFLVGLAFTILSDIHSWPSLLLSLLRRKHAYTTLAHKIIRSWRDGGLGIGGLLGKEDGVDAT